MNFKAKGLDHVAIAVADLDAAIRTYRDLLGLELAEVEGGKACITSVSKWRTSRPLSKP